MKSGGIAPTCDEGTRITNLHVEHFPGVSSSIYLSPGLFSVKLFPKSSSTNKYISEERREPHSSRMMSGLAFWVFAPTSMVHSMFRYAAPNYNNFRSTCGYRLWAVEWQCVQSKGFFTDTTKTRGFAVHSYAHFTKVDTRIRKQSGLMYFMTTLKWKLIIKLCDWIRIWFFFPPTIEYQ